MPIEIDELVGVMVEVPSGNAEIDAKALEHALVEAFRGAAPLPYNDHGEGAITTVIERYLAGHIVPGSVRVTIPEQNPEAVAMRVLEGVSFTMIFAPGHTFSLFYPLARRELRIWRRRRRRALLRLAREELRRRSARRRGEPVNDPSDGKLTITGTLTL